MHVMARHAAAITELHAPTNMMMVRYVDQWNAEKHRAQHFHAMERRVHGSHDMEMPDDRSKPRNLRSSEE